MFKKANSKLGILSKIRWFITENTTVRINKTMIRPYLEYVDFIIESSTKEKVQRLDALQNNALHRIEYIVEILRIEKPMRYSRKQI